MIPALPDMNRLSVLMTVFNESNFVDYAIRACLPHVDDLVIVEGSYQQSMRVGANPRSDDGTLDILDKYVGNNKVVLKQANEESDAQQRNVGLEEIKKLNPDGWMLIIDGDEIYDENNLKMVKLCANNMEKTNKYASYFKSITFVNDFLHFTEQEFPRLFKITAGCQFVNDNFLNWADKGVNWFSPYIIKIPYIKYHHYAFCKDVERTVLKKSWWENRFDDRKFEYDWFVNEDDQVESTTHEIYEYTGQHPNIMKEHPLWRKSYETNPSV